MIFDEKQRLITKQKMEAYFDRLWPICRSVAGPGFRESLDILSEIMPMERFQFETGQKVFDWTVPKEWVVRDGYFIDPNGKKWADFKANNLHLVSHSIPVNREMSLEELKPHLHSLPDKPNAIPYLTSYYKEDWGFCLSHDDFKQLPAGKYRVVIDAELKPGILEIGEVVLPGETDEEIFFSTYLCHPSLANKELSGPLVVAFLYERLAALTTRRLTYRFAVVPETIGAIAYLTKRGALLSEKMIAGYVVTCVGDRGSSFTYKKSRRGDTLADRAALAVLQDVGSHKIIPFFAEGGSDERQYCSPGFNLPVGSLMRTIYADFPEYHTSLDNKKVISFDAMLQSIDVYAAIAHVLESNYVWKNTVMYGEPQLGARGLYGTMCLPKQAGENVPAIMRFLNLADGTRDVITITEQSGISINTMLKIIPVLLRAGLIETIKENEPKRIRT